MDKTSLDRNMEVAQHYIESKTNTFKNTVLDEEVGKNDAKHTITVSERIFSDHLYKSIESSRKLTLKHSGYICTTYASTKKILKKTKNVLLLKKVESANVYRPDFVSHTHGLVIEIDGLIHDRDSNKIKNDTLREIALAGADYHVYRIHNKDISDTKSIYRHIDQINKLIAEIESDPKFKQKYQARRKKQSKFKRKFLECSPKQRLSRSVAKSRNKITKKTLSRKLTQQNKLSTHIYNGEYTVVIPARKHQK